MKKRLLISIFGVLAALLVSCGEPALPSAAPTPVPTPTAEPEIPFFTERADEISFDGGLVRVTVSRTDSTVTALTVEETGKRLPFHEGTPWLIYLNDAEGNLVLPTALTPEGDRLRVDFANGLTAVFRMESGACFFTMELETAVDDSVYAVFFGEIGTDPTCGWTVSSVAMTTNATPFELPGEGVSNGAGYAMPAVGTAGAKLAVVCSPTDSHRDSLKAAMETVDPARGVVSTLGGPWAMDAPGAYGDYVIMDWGIDPETAADVAALAADYSVDQIYLHQSSETFIQGSFTFPCALTVGERERGMTADASLFWQRIASVMEEKGVMLGLHTYSSLVPDTAEDILTDPVRQRQIAYSGSWTLAEDIVETDGFLPTREDGSTFVRSDILIPWIDVHTAYVLVDEEIILVEWGEEGGLDVGGRGMLGTKEAPHSAGAEIRHLSGIYGMFQPEPCSDLFYEIARRTGRACREGGFSVIYLDGLESLCWFVEPGTEWYYYAEFIRAILAECEETPLMDYSTFCPATWNAQGKDGGVDYATRAYKRHKEQHVEYNLYLEDAYIPAALGWFHCAPDMDDEYKNMWVKTMFRDDLDRLGVLSLACDMPLSYTPFSPWDMERETRLADNMGYYALYSALREADYFAPEVLERLRDLNREFRLIRSDSGEFAMEEMGYAVCEFENSGETVTAVNPFGEQAPLVRVEGRYSSLGEDEITLLELDETLPLWELSGEHLIQPTDISGRMALRVRAYGTGSSEDAVLISIRSPEVTEGGRTDFLVTLDHTGWKDFWLIDSDCGDTGDFVFDVATDGVDYECYRALVDPASITSVTVNFCGPCEGARLDDITACVLTAGAVEDPTLTVNGRTVTFETVLRGGEYIEYDPVSGRAVHFFYEDGAARSREIPVRGGVILPGGEFAVTYEARSLTHAPARARVVLGTAGELLRNPAAWEAPAVTVPAGAEEVWNENSTILVG